MTLPACGALRRKLWISASSLAETLQSKLECFLDRGSNQECAAIAAQHAFRLSNVHKLQQFVVKARRIDQHDGLGMQFQGLPGKNLE